MRTTSVPLILGSAALALGGCGSDLKKIQAQQRKEDVADARATARLTAEMSRTYGPRGFNADWYPLVEKVKLTLGGTYAQVTTSIYPDAEGESVANDVCGATLAVIDRAGTSVDVFADDGESLASCERTG